jgi:hypothetical protein
MTAKLHGRFAREVIFVQWRFLFIALIQSISLAAAPGVATDAGSAPERIVLRGGTSEATVRGTVSGYEDKDYRLVARAHQVLSVRLRSSNMYTVFRIVSDKPEADRKPLAAEVASFTGELSESGEYAIRVFMMRTGARKKNAVADFTLKVSLR